MSRSGRDGPLLSLRKESRQRFARGFAPSNPMLCFLRWFAAPSPWERPACGTRPPNAGWQQNNSQSSIAKLFLCVGVTALRKLAAKPQRINQNPAENYSQPAVLFRENNAGRTAGPLCDVRSQRGRCASVSRAAGLPAACASCVKAQPWPWLFLRASATTRDCFLTFSGLTFLPRIFRPAL